MRGWRWAGWLLCAAGLLAAAPVRGEEVPEYRLKAAFLYNFIVYTTWPQAPGTSLKVCIHGPDPFGSEIDVLQGKPAADRAIVVLRKTPTESLQDCQAVFFAGPALHGLGPALDALRGRPVLTVADTAGAIHRGVMLNMTLTGRRLSFEANLAASRGAGLELSSKLLRLATEVRQ